MYIAADEVQDIEELRPRHELAHEDNIEHELVTETYWIEGVSIHGTVNSDRLLNSK